MKKVTLLCGMLLALTASIASAAAGVNLRWTACIGDGGAQNKTFACNSNNGASLLIGSFEMGALLTQSTGIEIVIDVATAGSSLPAWWQFKNAGACRQLALTMKTDALALGGVACSDWSNGGAAGGLAAFTVGIQGPNTGRILGALAEAAPFSDLSPGQEWYAFTATISNVKTAGLGACAGCTTPACLVFNSIKCATNPVVGQPSRDVLISGPANGSDSNFALWQGGGGIVVGSVQGCPAAVPTHNSTWSSVKSMYR